MVRGMLKQQVKVVLLFYKGIFFNKPDQDVAIQGRTDGCRRVLKECTCKYFLQMYRRKR